MKCAHLTTVITRKCRCSKNAKLMPTKHALILAISQCILLHILQFVYHSPAGANRLN